MCCGYGIIFTEDWKSLRTGKDIWARTFSESKRSVIIGFVSGLYTAPFGPCIANVFAWVGLKFDKPISMLISQKEYHWEELWRAIIGILEFLAVRVDDVKNLGRVDELVQEVSS